MVFKLTPDWTANHSEGIVSKPFLSLLTEDLWSYATVFIGRMSFIPVAKEKLIVGGSS